MPLISFPYLNALLNRNVKDIFIFFLELWHFTSMSLNVECVCMCVKIISLLLKASSDIVRFGHFISSQTFFSSFHVGLFFLSVFMFFSGTLLRHMLNIKKISFSYTSLLFAYTSHLFIL